MPLFIAIGPIAGKFIPDNVNEDPTSITITAFTGLIITVILVFFFIRKTKSDGSWMVAILI
jgi:hypothetical protein